MTPPAAPVVIVFEEAVNAIVAVDDIPISKLTARQKRLTAKITTYRRNFKVYTYCRPASTPITEARFFSIM